MTITQTRPSRDSGTYVRGQLAWGLLRLLMAGLAIAALATQLVYELGKASAQGGPYARSALTSVGDFFGTFTYLSCVTMAVVLVLSGLHALRGFREKSALSVAFFGASANMVFVGLFFNIALRWTVPEDSIAWVNETVHVILPLFALIDALLGKHPAPPRGSIWLTSLLGVAWTVYTQVRGPLVTDRSAGSSGWYPYAFVDPATVPGGTAGAVIISLALTGVITGVGFVISAVARKTQGHL